jgi:hypothetical protein
MGAAGPEAGNAAGSRPHTAVVAMPGLPGATASQGLEIVAHVAAPPGAVAEAPQQSGPLAAVQGPAGIQMAAASEGSSMPDSDNGSMVGVAFMVLWLQLQHCC